MQARDTWTPLEVAEVRSIRIVDIRPRAERIAGLGYIPGSRLFPADLLLADMAILGDAYAMETPIAVVCQSGRRARELLGPLRAAGFANARVLEGGMLGWGAAGLPLCGVLEPHSSELPNVPELSRFPRVLAACFVAVSVEHADPPEWEGKDPFTHVMELLDEERHGGKEVTAPILERLVDRLAEDARGRGFPLTTIQSNTDRMKGALARFHALPDA